MTTNSSRMVRVSMVTAGAALMAALVLAPRAAAEEVVKTYTVSGRAQVHVDTNDGSVKVITGDTKQVEFHVQYQGYELDKDLHVDAKQSGDTVELNARIAGHWGISWGHNTRNLSIEVHMP